MKDLLSGYRLFSTRSLTLGKMSFYLETIVLMVFPCSPGIFLLLLNEVAIKLKENSHLSSMQLIKVLQNGIWIFFLKDFIYAFEGEIERGHKQEERQREKKQTSC